MLSVVQPCKPVIRGRRALRAAAVVLAVVSAAGFAGCESPAAVANALTTPTTSWQNPNGLSTTETLYRGWDHVFRISDGTAELIFSPGLARVLRFGPVGPPATVLPAARPSGPAGPDEPALPGTPHPRPSTANAGRPEAAMAISNSPIAVSAAPAPAAPAAGGTATPDQLDRDNLIWLNPKWAGLYPVPGQHDSEDELGRDYPLFGGISQWPGPQEAWPTLRVPDTQRMVDVEVHWPPDRLVDMIPMQFQKADEGRCDFVGVRTSIRGLEPTIHLAAVGPQNGAIDVDFGQTNTENSKQPGASWISLPLRTEGWLAVDRSQLTVAPKGWPSGTIMAGGWAIFPLNAATPAGFELNLLPPAGAQATLFVVQDECLLSLAATRPESGAYPAGRSLFTVAKQVIGCPPQIDLLDPAATRHFEIAASTPLVDLPPQSAIHLKLRLSVRRIPGYTERSLGAQLAQGGAAAVNQAAGFAAPGMTQPPAPPQPTAPVTPPAEVSPPPAVPPAAAPRPVPAPTPGPTPSPRPATPPAQTKLPPEFQPQPTPATPPSPTPPTVVPAPAPTPTPHPDQPPSMGPIDP
ncbi:MAG: hypothetical protein ACREJ2_12835 [Planctomycetota bacterium]